MILESCIIFRDFLNSNKILMDFWGVLSTKAILIVYIYTERIFILKRKNDIWRSVVKEIKIISTTPGYEYVYFKDGKEADAYFTEVCGKNWKDEPWARFYLKRADEAETIKVQRRNSYKPITVENNPAVVVNVQVRDPNNYHYLVKKLIQRGVTSPEQIKELLNSKGYSVDWKKLNRLIRQYTSKSRYDKFAVSELIKSYGKIPLREVVKRLAEEEINVSHEYVRKVLRNIE